MKTLGKYLKNSKISFKTLEIAKKNAEIAQERVVLIEQFQIDLDSMVEKVKNIVKSENLEIQSIKISESEAYDTPHKPEIVAEIKIVFADTFDDEFFDKFDKMIQKALINNNCEIMVLDDNYQKTITIDVRLILKKFLLMEV